MGGGEEMEERVDRVELIGENGRRRKGDEGSE